MSDRQTKKERRELRKLEELEKMETTKKSGSMRWIVILVAIALFIGFGVYAVMASKQKQEAPVTLSSSGWVTGNPKSHVTLTEFGDFQCPACLAFEPNMRNVRADYGKKVKIVFKHFPLKQAHPNAMAAAIAAEAAGKQGKFWQFHDKLYDNQDTWAPLADPTPEFLKYAADLKLDITQFKKDLSDKTLANKINAQEDEGIKIGVDATPTVYINGKYVGVPSYTDLKSKIDSALAATK